MNQVVKAMLSFELKTKSIAGQTGKPATRKGGVDGKMTFTTDALHVRN